MTAATTPAALVASWLVTYWAHGLLAGAAALAAGRWLLRAPAARDPLWKAALVVPLVSATLATVAPRPAALATVRLGERVRALLPGVGGAAEVRRLVIVRHGRRVERVTVIDSVAAAASPAVLFVAAVGGGVGVLGVARRRRALARAIRGRRRLHHAPLGDPALTLSESAALSAPVALGAREVCVPPSFWSLSPRQRRGVLVHECAHLERRDPLWIAAAELVAAASVQPLARLVVARLRRDAEFICDEVAVRRTRDARALVESLAELARQFDPAAPRPARAPLVPGYLDSPLAARARRVLGVDLAAQGGTSTGRAMAWGAIALLALALAAAPAISTGASVEPGLWTRPPKGMRRVEIVRIGMERAAPAR
jgi:hypothetical protein